MSTSNVSIVIGSWGSYNECNERALGPSWIDLADYNTWEEIEEELVKQGFKLDGIDEELFIQDVDGFPVNSTNWDNTHPKDFFELLVEANVLDNDSKYNTMCAFLEVRSIDEFQDLVKSHGQRWDDEILIFEGSTWEDYGKEYFEMCGYNVPTEIEGFIDFEAYGQYIGSGYAEEYSDGIIEIRY